MSFSKACDVTGLVAVACAQHGCFAPNGMVDLFRGKQQKNADWAFLGALKGTNVDSDQGVMLIYDIACQYFVHLQEHIGDHLPPGLIIDHAIGLFHVHAHKNQCFYRYATSFIPTCGVLAGEILEPLWGDLNKISISVRTATLAYRAEVLHDHASDSNFRKGLNMGKYIDILNVHI